MMDWPGWSSAGRMGYERIFSMIEICLGGNNGLAVYDGYNIRRHGDTIIAIPQRSTETSHLGSAFVV
jgi:hypothetical protein